MHPPDVFSEVTKAGVAPRTEDPANATRLVIVIDTIRIRAAADATDAALSADHRRELARAEPIATPPAGGALVLRMRQAPRTSPAATLCALGLRIALQT
jgi:hypothetical protein